MNSITLTDNITFDMAVNAVAREELTYQIDSSNLSVQSPDIDAVIDVLTENGIEDYSVTRDCDESDLDDSSEYDNRREFEWREFLKLKIKNYIENQHLNGNYPTVKQIQSRMKGHGFSVDQILEIATYDLNYIPSASYDSGGNGIPTGQLQILPPFFKL